MDNGGEKKKKKNITMTDGIGEWQINFDKGMHVCSVEKKQKLTGTFSNKNKDK